MSSYLLKTILQQWIHVSEGDDHDGNPLPTMNLETKLFTKYSYLISICKACKYDRINPKFQDDFSDYSSQDEEDVEEEEEEEEEKRKRRDITRQCDFFL
jgi:hypothetical protein